MANTVIELKFSQTPSATPTTLANGEISINTNDGKFFYKDPSGTIQSFDRYPGPSGLNKEIQFNDSGTLGANASLTFDKTTGNLYSLSIKSGSYIEFGDGTKQYTANAGAGGGGVTSVAGATGAVSNTQLLDGIKTVDGTGSGLDADLLDGLNSTSFGNSVFTQAAFDKANTDVTSVSVSAGTYGNATIIPVITLAANGRVTAVSNTAITVNGGSSSWIKKTTTYTASVYDQIIADTSGGSFTINLPATPTTGQFVVIGDGANWSVNNLTVGKNGSTIEGLNEDLIVDIEGIRIDFVYDGTTWEVYAFAPPTPAIVDDTTTDTTEYLMTTRNTSGPITNTYIASTSLYFNPSSGTVSATNFNSLSDIKYKKNITPIQNGLETVSKIEPVSFEWVKNNNRAYGVIAQDIEKILPEIVETTNDTKTVSYDQLIPFMIQAIKELKQEIQELKVKK